jgi:hypothetical protein
VLSHGTLNDVIRRGRTDLLRGICRGQTSASPALAALLLFTVAYGLGAGEAVLVVGLAAAPVVMLLTYRELRSRS